MHATVMITPAPQHMQALQRANAVRLARAELKRRVTKGLITAASVVQECPMEAESMTVFDLLASQRRWGETRCRKFLQSAGISETKTIGSMTRRQRELVGMMLGSTDGGACADEPARLQRVAISSRWPSGSLK